MTESILPTNALRGLRLGFSVSESEDLPRLGLLENHFRLAVGEIARSVLVLGGGLVYGGHLDPNGYTSLLAFELQRYGRKDEPLIIVLPWQVHRGVSIARLRQWKRNLGLYGKVVTLDVNGNEIDGLSGRADEPEVISDTSVVATALTSMRREISTLSNARVLVGGKRRGYTGSLPGILEEVLISIQRRTPLYLAGGFGGATLDVLRTVSPETAAWAADLSRAPTDVAYMNALDTIKQQYDRADGLVSNGLSAEENALLAATHRPSEIAALVSLGLGRLGPSSETSVSS